MLLHIRKALGPEVGKDTLDQLGQSPWGDGRETTGAPAITRAPGSRCSNAKASGIKTTMLSECGEFVGKPWLAEP